MGRRPVIRGLVVLLACCAGLMRPALASDGWWDLCERSGTTLYNYFPATTVYLDRYVADGDVIGPWISTGHTPSWKCRRSTVAEYSGLPVQVSVQLYSPYLKIRSIDHEGESYGLYYAGYTAEPIAYIARWRAQIDGRTTDWTPLTTDAGIYQFPVSGVEVVKATGETYTILVETQIRLVKRQGLLTELKPGHRQLIFDPVYMRHYQDAGNGVPVAGVLYRIGQVPAASITFEGGGTCTTPDVNVSMAPVSTSSFAGVGSAASNVSFNVMFQDCPPGMAGLEYKFVPDTPLPAAGVGVVGLDPGSSASGVGVQFLREDGEPLVFDEFRTLHEYDPAQMASYVVRLHARYFQVDPVVGTGTVRAHLNFTLRYP